MTDTAVDHARRLMQGLALTVRETRKQENVTVRELADLLGCIDAPKISFLETGRWIPTPDQHSAITQWLLQHPLRDPSTSEQCVSVDSPPTAS